MSDRNDPGDAMGRLEAWGPDRVIASGLKRIAQGAVVDIEGGGRALVTAFYHPSSSTSPTARISARSPGSGGITSTSTSPKPMTDRPTPS